MKITPTEAPKFNDFRRLCSTLKSSNHQNVCVSNHILKVSVNFVKRQAFVRGKYESWLTQVYLLFQFHISRTFDTYI